MTRVVRHGKWSNRAFRAGALIKSASVMARLWRSMTWHEKMWLVFIGEKTPAEEWTEFAAKAARGLRRAWVIQMSEPAANGRTESGRR